MTPSRLVPLAAAIAVLFAGTAAAAEPKPRDAQRELNYEYAKLYKAVSGLRLADELLLLKFESKETEELVEQVAAFGSRAKAELEDLARANPAIRFDEDGRTALSKEISKRQKKDRLRTYAPVIGASGPDFERMLLLGQSATLYQLRFRVDAMADAETREPRRKYLLAMRKDLDRLYALTTQRLDQEFFRGPASTPLGVIGSGED